MYYLNSFCESGIQTQFSWALCFRIGHGSVIKVSAQGPSQACNLDVGGATVISRFSQGRISFQAHLVVEMHMKATTGYHFTPVRMAVIRKAINSNYWQGYGEKGTLMHCWWDCKLVQSLQKIVWKFLKKLKIVWSNSFTS